MLAENVAIALAKFGEEMGIVEKNAGMVIWGVLVRDLFRASYALGMLAIGAKFAMVGLANVCGADILVDSHKLAQPRLA